MTEEYEDLIYWLWLTQIRGLGPVGQHELLSIGNSPKELYELARGKEGPELYSELIRPHLMELLWKFANLDEAEKLFEICNRKEIKLITLANGLPERFSSEPHLPVLLYAKGETLQELTGTGIIGGRRCTREAKERAISLAKEACENGEIVISGMAKGIDSYAHTAAVRQKGKTIAVLGNGVDICYPSEHQELMNAIMENGTLLSEYPPGTFPGRFRFPQRNRIIAALSNKLYVVGAGEHSGTGSTVMAAEKYGVPAVNWRYYE